MSSLSMRFPSFSVLVDVTGCGEQVLKLFLLCLVGCRNVLSAMPPRWQHSVYQVLLVLQEMSLYFAPEPSARRSCHLYVSPVDVTSLAVVVLLFVIAVYPCALTIDVCRMTAMTSHQ